MLVTLSVARASDHSRKFRMFEGSCVDMFPNIGLCTCPGDRITLNECSRKVTHPSRWRRRVVNPCRVPLRVHDGD